MSEETREKIIETLKGEALNGADTGWLSDLARRGLAWEERDEVIVIGEWFGSVDVGHLAGIVESIISKHTEERTARLEQAEQAVARVREAIKDAPTSDPTRGFAGPPDDYPDIEHFIGNGEWSVAERVRRALDGEQ